MKLTSEQSRKVEENMALIHWYINLKGLDTEEWWDLLAIELCKTVAKYDSKKGSLANYFKFRCDFVIAKEYQKSKAQKRTNNGVYDIEENFASDAELVKLSYDYNEDILESIILQELIEGEHGDIVRLKYAGYTQAEISDILGISQSQVSKILKEIRNEIEQDESFE